MAINWNREITGKDVKKFFNQEIKLGEMDYSKCMQVSLLIFALGIVPAFTYGMVLGVLDEQRVALMSEVSSLKAQVISSTSSIPRLPMIYGATTDKTVYTLGTTTLVRFYNSYPASTTNIFSIDLYSSSTLVQRIATMSPRAGLNQVSFKVATSSLEKTNAFHVRVTATKYGLFADTNKFTVQRYAVDTRPVIVDFVSSGANKSFVADVDGDKDVGTFVINYKVTAGVDNDVYLRRKGIAWATTTDSTTGKALSVTHTATNSSAKDTQDSYFIPKGFTRSFVTRVDLEATRTGFAGVTIKSIEWGTTSPSAYPNKTVIVDSNVFKTNILYLNSFAQTAPRLSVEKVTAVTLPGDVSLLQSDIGVFRFRANITAGDSDVYIASSTIRSAGAGFILQSRGPEVSGRFPVTVMSKPNPKDTANYSFIPRGTSRSFDVIVFAEPLRTGEFSVGIAVYWGNTPDTMFRNFFEQQLTSPRLFLNAR